MIFPISACNESAWEVQSRAAQATSSTACCPYLRSAAVEPPVFVQDNAPCLGRICGVGSVGSGPGTSTSQGRPHIEKDIILYCAWLVTNIVMGPAMIASGQDTECVATTLTRFRVSKWVKSSGYSQFLAALTKLWAGMTTCGENQPRVFNLFLRVAGPLGWNAYIFVRPNLVVPYFIGPTLTVIINYFTF